MWQRLLLLHRELSDQLHPLPLAALRTPHPHSSLSDWPNSFLLRLSFLHLACVPSDRIDGMAS